MNLENMTLKEIKELQSLFEQPKQKRVPFEVGKNYFIRSVTHYYTGRLTDIVGEWLVLDEASWIADTGRFHDFLKDGKCNEYESFISPVYVPMGSVIDITEWKFPLFKGQE